MKVFVTGATGFVGTAIVQELLDAGHQVLGLARSEASAKKLIAAGAEVHYGDLEDLQSLREAAAKVDGVIHAGFIHDFSRFPEVCEVDKKAIEAIGEVLAGTGNPLIVTSGSALVSPGMLATEDIITKVNPAWPRVSEQGAAKVAAMGVPVSIVRLSPSVHGEDDRQGFIPILVNIAKQKSASGYIEDGLNTWNAVHRLDAARLFRLALESSSSDARFHAAAEEAITVKSIAEAIGKQLNLPVISIKKEDAEEHFGWFAHMAGIDCPTSSAWTQEQLNWQPTHATLMTDIESGIYTS